MKMIFLRESLNIHVHYSWKKARVLGQVYGSSALEHDSQNEHRLVVLLPIKSDPLKPFKRLSLLQHTDSCPEKSKPTAS